MSAERPDPRKLAPLDADALAVLALDGREGWSRSHWLRRANEAGLVDERGRKLTQDGFRLIIDGLFQAGATARNARSDNFIVPSWKIPAIEAAHRRGHLVPIAQGLRAGGRHAFYGYRQGLQGMGVAGELLVALATGDAAAVQRAVALVSLDARIHSSDVTLATILGADIPEEWLAQLAPESRTAYLKDCLRHAFVEPGSIPLGAAVRAAASAESEVETRAWLAVVLALAGDAKEAHAVLDASPTGFAQWTLSARGFVALTEGRFADARRAFEEAGVGSRRQRVDLVGPFAIFDVLLAATSDRAADVADVARRLVKGRRHFERCYWGAIALEEVAELRTTGAARRPGHPRLAAKGSTRASGWIELLVCALCERWRGEEPSEKAWLPRFAEAASLNGYSWLAAELARVERGERECSLLGLYGTKEAWELALESIRAAVGASIDGSGTSRAKAARDAGGEVWWTVGGFGFLELGHHWLGVDAYVVSRPGTKGKKISVRRLLSPDADKDGVRIDDHDRRVAQAIDLHATSLLPPSILSAFVGHPRVRDEDGATLTIEAGEAKLVVEPSKSSTRVRLVPERFDASGTALEREGSRVTVFAKSALVDRIAAALPPGGIVVPAEGRPALAALLAEAGTAIAVDARGAVVSKDAVSGDARVHVQLFRAGNGLRARLRVVPGTTAGPSLRAGVPPAETVIELADGLTRVKRDLAAERVNLDALLDRCPTLASLPRDGDDLVANDLETCFELLVELRSAELDVVVAWLEGQPLRVSAVRGAKNLRMQVSGDTRWLDLQGALAVDDTRVLSMRELLDHASRAASGRFLRLGDDELLALSEDLAGRLAKLVRLDALAARGKLPAALLPAVSALCEGADVSFADAIAKQRAALERCAALDVRTPRGLAAELRDYQRDGFRFLARRTEAGLGACLADDMGLGKTVQALALLLHRRKSGPALVVAPTSVCRNWESEAARFAPGLNVVRFGDGERRATIEAARAGDLVVASYGLLAAEEELLASRTWGTVIFDEAHALKNATTKRWSAARALKTQAAVALTGTPVENHARELHALFDVLAPGLLGSRAAFDRALGAPIAEGDRDAAALLRTLVRPFVLRRTKSEVLAELPPKTEVEHVIAASAEHLAFYEAVRRRAVERVVAAKTSHGASAGRARIDLLAEIMRLRRAAIDPRLVGGDAAPAGGKIDALVELVTELREEGRRALVFSQFLEVLDLARAALEASGVECLRLDGTMSAGVREEVVSAFQSGRGDVFLVSLKAGGVGMNLTAADVVILLDPWWNPAVEDQAAGRAHRIGQTRPVTVARLVTEGTIEEKVLALHAKKRRLYEDVVSEADGAGTVDVDAMLALLGAEG